MHLVEKILLEYYGSAGAGVLPLCTTTQRILVALRSSEVNSPNTWGNFGGKIEGEDNSVQEVAMREFQEETGFSGNIKLIPAYVYRDEGFVYHNFIGLVEEEFEPNLDWENSTALWLTFEEILNLKRKHWGLDLLLHHSFNIIKKYLDLEILQEKMVYEPQNFERLKQFFSKVLTPGEFQIEKVSHYPNGSEIAKVNISLRDFGKIDRLIQIARIAGWYPSLKMSWGLDDDTVKFDLAKLHKDIQEGAEEIRIVFEKQFDDKIEKLPRYIYHVVPSERYEKIKKIGLNPKTHSKLAYHPGRVYFGLNLKYTKQLAAQLYNRELDHEHIKGTYKLLRISTETLPKDIEFFNDPDYDNGIYTYSSIHPGNIKVAATFSVKKDFGYSSMNVDDLLVELIRNMTAQ